MGTLLIALRNKALVMKKTIVAWFCSQSITNIIGLRVASQQITHTVHGTFVVIRMNQLNEVFDSFQFIDLETKPMRLIRMIN